MDTEKKSRIKDFARAVTTLTVLAVPYLAMHNIDSQLWAIKNGQREYVECASIRLVENRRNVLDAQDKILDYIFK